MNRAGILFAGLPASGKSTYIGLLFMAIDAGKGSLRLTGFQGDFEYVNELADRLSKCAEAIRTDINLVDGFNAELVTTNGEAFALRLPDYSGETWKTALEARGWSEAVEDEVRTSTGVCLFINVGAVINDGTILEAHRLMSSLGEQADDFTANSSDEEEAVGGTPVVTTQVALVDLIQELTRRRIVNYCRLSLVLSAFDLAGDIAPEKWLELNLPLLDQFLRSNREEIATRVFGVSAQGGRFDRVESKEELRNRPTVERAFVKDGAGRLVAIDAPVLWAADVDLPDA
jgi:hypothetical protein